jgi:transcriptional regulator with XRE-family HTH domain
MLSVEYGKVIKDHRHRKGLNQQELADKAQVSRAVLSRLEQGKPSAVQSDTIDRILDALEVKPQVIGQLSPNDARMVARLEQEKRLYQQRERHLRLALDLAADDEAAAAKIEKARERVELWRNKKSCSSFYIERWNQLLALPPRKIAREMSSFGEWEDALFQNSPWFWAWK